MNSARDSTIARTGADVGTGRLHDRLGDDA